MAVARADHLRMRMKVSFLNHFGASQFPHAHRFWTMQFQIALLPHNYAEYMGRYHYLFHNLSPLCWLIYLVVAVGGMQCGPIRLLKILALLHSTQSGSVDQPLQPVPLCVGRSIL
jgi:hypothetical protein